MEYCIPLRVSQPFISREALLLNLGGWCTGTTLPPNRLAQNPGNSLQQTSTIWVMSNCLIDAIKELANMHSQEHSVTDTTPQTPVQQTLVGSESEARTPLRLVELDPHWVVKGLETVGEIVAEGANAIGRVREKCPYCGDVSLQLVLRYRSVIWSHLYCGKCMRCYDALYPDGRSALNPIAQAIE